MAEQVILPRLGQGMESGTIVRWLKAEGDAVEKGEPLFELDTDKVTQEVEADAGGVLLRILVAEGEVPVGTAVAFLGKAGEAVPEVEPVSVGTVPETRQETTTAEEGGTVPRQPQPEPERIEVVAPNGRIKASPLARRIARERGIDLAALRGTGPEGRIVAEDVERAAVSGPPPAAPARAAAVERVELTSVRRTIARRLTEAWQVPVFQLQASADMTRVSELVARLRERGSEPHVTVTDVLAAVCAAALMRHPEVNAQYAEDAILRFPAANVGIAVAAPQGLVVPVVRGAERLRLAEIAAVRSDLVRRAREGKLRQEDLEDGTFTISNLGMYRVERFTAVLNPPQAAIVAVGAIEDRAVPLEGEVVVRPTMTLVGTFDHRAVDGAPAAGFLQTVKDALEEPGLAL